LAKAHIPLHKKCIDVELTLRNLKAQKRYTGTSVIVPVEKKH